MQGPPARLNQLSVFARAPQENRVPTFTWEKKTAFPLLFLRFITIFCFFRVVTISTEFA